MAAQFLVNIPGPRRASHSGFARLTLGVALVVAGATLAATRTIHPRHDPAGPCRTPRAGVVVGAAVLVTDQDTGVPRTGESDSAGNFENPQPARRQLPRRDQPVWVVKNFQQPDVVLRRARWYASTHDSPSAGVPRP